MEGKASAEPETRGGSGTNSRVGAWKKTEKEGSRKEKNIDFDQ